VILCARAANLFYEDLLNFGCVSDDLQSKVLNGLEILVNEIRCQGNGVNLEQQSNEINPNFSVAETVSIGRGRGSCRGRG
jgi:hypothetical protein